MCVRVVHRLDRAAMIVTPLRYLFVLTAAIGYELIKRSGGSPIYSEGHPPKLVQLVRCATDCTLSSVRPRCLRVAKQSLASGRVSKQGALERGSIL